MGVIGTALGRAVQGLAAGCVGLVALEMTSYLDQFVRARASSDSPTELGRRLADEADLDLGVGEARTNRASALGPLAGYSDGLGLGVAWGLLAPTGANVAAGTALLATGAWIGSNGPLLALGISDPRDWTRQEWLTDLWPHVAYGLATAVTVAVLRGASAD